MVKKVGKYELGRSLGEGTFGKVKHAVDTETNEAVAIKILDKERIQKQNMGNQIKKEISIMKMVKHKNIVGMIEVLASKTKIFIVLELVTGGELFDKIVQVGKLNEMQARFYFQQLIEGVEYCHKLGICHRDLKPENLLLDEHGNLKISDFGLSSLYVGDADGEAASRTELLHTTCGTPNYVAPEVLSDQGYDGKKADVWSCGVILYVLLAGFLPFDESTIVALFAKIQHADFTYPSWFTPEVRSLLDTMLVADPKQRATLAMIKQHSWYQGSAGHHPDITAAASAEPTLAQLEAAVQPISSNSKNEIPATSVEPHDVSALREEDLDDFDYPTNSTAPIHLNAFDLVSQCGGFMMDRMFSPEIFYTVPLTAEETAAKVVAGASASAGTGTVKVPSLAPKKSFTSVGGSILFGNKPRPSNLHQFTASNITAEALMTTVLTALQTLSFTFEMPKQLMFRTGRIKANYLSPKGMVGMFIQVFVLTENVCLLMIRKGKGDLLEWNTVYQELVEKHLASIVNRLNSEDADAKEFF